MPDSGTTRKSFRVSTLRIALAMLPPLGAAILQTMLWAYVQPFIWFFFYPAIFFSSWIGGMSGGVLATFVSIALVDYFFIPPTFSFALGNPNIVATIAMFAVMGFLISFLHRRLRQSRQLASEALASVRSANDLLEERIRIRTRSLRESEARLRDAQRNARIGSWHYVPPDSLNCSDELHDLLQLPPDEPVTPGAMIARIHPDDRHGCINSFTRAEKSGAMDDGLVFRMLRADGTVMVVNLLGTINRDPGGRVIDAVGTLQDVSIPKKAEERLRLLSSALESTANAIVITDRTGVIEWVNPALSSLTGYSKAEAIGHNPGELVKSGQHSPAFYRDLWTTILAGHIWRGEMVNRRKDGTLYHEFLTITPVRNDHNEIEHFIAIKEDITARKQADARIRELSEVIDNTPVAITIADLSDRVIYCNQGALRIYGFRKDQTLGRKVADIFPPETMRHIGAAQSAGLTNGFWEGEVPIQTVDGRSIKVEAIISIIHDEAGLPKARLVIGTDITARKQAETRIREQSEMIDQSPVAITIAGPTGQILYCNQGASNLYGIKRELMVGKNVDEIFSPETLRHSLPAVDVALATGFWKGELPVRTIDGRSIFIDAIISPVRDEAGQLKGRLLIGTDITEKKQLEEQALRAQRLDNIGMLAGGIAHDLNNALAPIIMAIPMLRRQVSDPGALGLLNMVERSSARGASLVRQMLSFARGAAAEKQPVQVNHLLREVLDFAQSAFPKSIEIESDLPPDLWPVLSDPTRIHQVFVNLCVNSRDAMCDGGKLTLSAANRALDAAEAAKVSPDARPGDFVAVEVRDTGTGIPPEVLEKIWDPFFTTKGDGKGTGLGLSTVRNIVRQHDGFVSVQTFPAGKSGHGTTFTVYLPAAKSERESETSSHVSETPQGKGELVLVVDDETPVCELISETLTRFGYTVMTAKNGLDAIVAFVPRAAKVRLLLTDLDMPTMNGPTLATALRRLNPHLPIVVMSGGDSRWHETHVKFATAFLSKPFDVGALLSTVRLALDALPQDKG